jgi:hypothetical protein
LGATLCRAARSSLLHKPVMTQNYTHHTTLSLSKEYS